MNHRFHRLTPIFLIFLALPFFAERYQIADVSYSLEKTREQDLKRVVPIDFDKIFEGKDEFDAYLLDLRQRLLNTRAFDNVELEFDNEQFGEKSDEGKVSPYAPTSLVATPSPKGDTPLKSPDEDSTYTSLEPDEITKISLHIEASDTKSLLILPYPKYDSNGGLIFKVKVKDVNFWGTLNTMDVGAFIGLKEDLKTGEQNLTYGAEFKYSYPFQIGSLLCSWNNSFELEYTQGVNELEFWSSTGFTIEKPFKRFSLVFDASENFNRDLEYEDFDDTQYFATKLKFSVPVKVYDIDNWGYIYWTPFVDFKFCYDKDGIMVKNDDLASPVVSGGQYISTSRINWIGNFRTGISAKIGHSYGYDFKQEEIEPRVFAEIQAFKGFEYCGINARFSAFITKSNRGKIGPLIRGVRDEQKYLNPENIELVTKKALKTPSAMVLNLDFPIHLITTHWLDWSDAIFGEDSWFSRTFAWTDKFNFELQISPFIDIALTKNEITGRLFSPKDGWYTGGIELLCFPERWKGIVMRTSVGIDLGRAVISKKFPDKIDMSWREQVKKYEIYAGIGLSY